MRLLLLFVTAALAAFGGLIDAVRNDDRALAEQLLRGGAKANERDEDGDRKSVV